MKQRVIEPEAMDDPALDPQVHEHALRGLQRLNTISRSAALVYASIRDLAPPAGSSPLTVLDIATGGGDLPIRLALLAERRGCAVQVRGSDISPTAIEHARRRARASAADVTFLVRDVLSDDPGEAADVVTCSLFLHHLEDRRARHLLEAMARIARRRVVINDLSRSALNTLLIWLGSRLVTRSPVVHCDAIRSARAAFTPAESARLADEAGFDGARVHQRFPCRHLLVWDKVGPS